MDKMISIIVPFYKSKNTLENCVKCLLNQTYKNIEILLVNDRGNDGSFEIAKRLEKTDSRIRVINKRHTGVSGTRNAGLREAKGYYVQFVDSDDTLEPDMCEKMVKLIESNNAELAVCDFDHPVFKNYLGDALLDLNVKEDLLKYVQTTFAVVVPWNKLWKREVITHYFDENVKLAEDDLFNIVNLENVKRIASTKECLYHYYIAPSSGAINDIAKQEEFWKNKSSFWYLRAMLYKKTYKQVREFLCKKDSKDISYAHIFDFMIWEFLILKQTGTDEHGMCEEMKQVFGEKKFIKSLNCRKRYGIVYNYRPKQDNGKRVEEYVHACYKFIADESASNLKQFYVMLYLFAKMFIVQKKNSLLSDNDIVAYAYKMIIDNNELEAKYVNNINTIM
ncbi:MAG: glycosyltransferase family 2 protein [Acholeplasmatales bacterium]|nr:glycosyltransferase family 2 protein [Acholeplasmatales bacterium]